MEGCFLQQNCRTGNSTRYSPEATRFQSGTPAKSEGGGDEGGALGEPLGGAAHGARAEPHRGPLDADDGGQLAGLVEHRRRDGVEVVFALTDSLGPAALRDPADLDRERVAVD